MTEEPYGPLETRTAEHGVEVVGVSFPERRIQLVVMPYERETTIREGGRVFTEVVARGAFDGIQRRAHKLPKVNMHHNVADTVGRVLQLYPNREEGLVADVFISKTRDDVLVMADEDLLHASAGFAVMPAKDGKPRGEEWQGRNRRRLTRLYLGHVALTPEPAYEGTDVLAVRKIGERVAAPPVTPNLASLRIQELERMYAELDARFQTG